MENYLKSRMKLILVPSVLENSQPEPTTTNDGYLISQAIKKNNRCFLLAAGWDVVFSGIIFYHSCFLLENSFVHDQHKNQLFYEEALIIKGKIMVLLKTKELWSKTSFHMISYHDLKASDLICFSTTALFSKIIFRLSKVN